MADLTLSDFNAQMSVLQYEPTRLLPMMHNYIEQAWGGQELVMDPSLPWSYLCEMNVAMGVAALNEDEILNTEQYPVMADGEKGLFKHIADVGYVNLFGSPSSGWFDIYMSVDEIIQKAVRVGQTGTRRITIPKHTFITVNNRVFTFQYPINIIVKSHGGIDIVYDGSRPSPLQALSGNKVDWTTLTLPAQTPGQTRPKMIRIRTKLYQMLLTSYTLSPSSAKITTKTYTLTDNFFYCRAFQKNDQGTWIEIKTTHSQQVFDPNDPTLLLQVVDGQLTVEIPYVYLLTNLVKSDIRVDVYTTQGPLIMELKGLSGSDFVAEWRDLDKDDNGIYVSPLSVMPSIGVLSEDTVTGGAAEPTFADKRARMLDNAIGDIVIPISNAQMGVTLENLGFDSSLVVDTVTERLYLATRPMPDNTLGLTSTGVDSAVITMRDSMTNILQYETVIDNGDRVTVTPKTLYRNIDGVLTFVSDADRKAIDLLSGDALVNKVSDGTYLYTPLHYVLDSSNGTFYARPYFLDSPTFDATSFIASNDTLALTISASSTRSIVRTEDGYTIQILTSSNDTYKALRDEQVHVQLAFKPQGESDFAYISGVQIAKNDDNERVFEFKLNTHWDISADHWLTLTNFNMYEPLERSYPVLLHDDFHLIWAVSDYTVYGAETTTIDTDMAKFLLPFGSVGVYHETMTTFLGDELSGLWAVSRAQPGDRKFLTYTTTTYATWETDNYTDPVTGRPVIITNPDGSKSLKLQNAKGTPKLNADGSKTILHAAGDAVLDEYLNPILESERNIIRWWDLCLFDGVYRYATDDTDAAYIKEVPTILVDWINDELGGVAKKTLDETEILFQPRSTLKFVEVLVDDSQLKTINTAQSLKIDYYVSQEVYGDTELREALEASAIAQVVAKLKSIEVSRNGIETAIAANAGTDVISVHLSGLGGFDNDFNVITLLDESTRLCVAKTLGAKADGKYNVLDAIEVNFRLHSVAA